MFSDNLIDSLVIIIGDEDLNSNFLIKRWYSSTKLLAQSFIVDCWDPYIMREEEYMYLIPDISMSKLKYTINYCV